MVDKLLLISATTCAIVRRSCALRAISSNTGSGASLVWPARLACSRAPIASTCCGNSGESRAKFSTALSASNKAVAVSSAIASVMRPGLSATHTVTEEIALTSSARSG